MEARRTRVPSRAPHPRGASAQLAALVATALVVAALAGCGSAVASTAFRGEAVGQATADPFTPSVGHDETGSTPPARVGGAVVGTTPGLYGGGGDAAVCDRFALARYLIAEPAKAAAWAGVLGIAPSDVPVYISRLTAVLLRADTAVTNHGYHDGAATSVPAVLQAGTAVLVDARGVPVVKCGSGNPLTAAPADHARYEGASWDGFTPDSVTTVTPAPEPVAVLVVADGGAGAVRPVGTNGNRDLPYRPGAGVPLSGSGGSVGAAVAPTTDPSTPAASGADAAASDYPGSDYPGPDYPLDTPGSDTYVASYGGPGAPAPFLSEDCRRAGFLDQPFSITLGIREGGVGRGEVTVVGSGSADGPVAIGRPVPSVDLGDHVSPEGTFSAGRDRTYATSTHEGVFSARWSGNLGIGRPRPELFPVTIRQSWHRDPDFVPWLPSSGGPDDYSCAFDVEAVRSS